MAGWEYAHFSPISPCLLALLSQNLQVGAVFLFIIAVSSACSVTVACFGFGDRCRHDINEEFVDKSVQSVELCPLLIMFSYFYFVAYNRKSAQITISEWYLLLMLNWSEYVKGITLDAFSPGALIPIYTEAPTPALSESGLIFNEELAGLQVEFT